MKHHISHLGRHHKLYAICLIGFLITFHLTLPAYVNSSFLGTFTDEGTVGLIYIIAAVFTLFGYLSVHRVLRRIGLYQATIAFALIEFVALFGMVQSGMFIAVAALFVVSTVLVNLIAFNIDIFLESDSDTQDTGSIRGLYLTVVNFAWLLAPMITGVLVADNDYAKVITVAAALLLPFIYLVNEHFARFKDPVYPELSVRASLNATFANKDLRSLFLANVTLQTFYAWMTVYTPIYLNKHLGYGWDDIGIIFTIMLVPFVLVDYPLGKIADKKYGEKEIMLAGFVILILSTLALSWLDHASIIWWGLLLFATRVGAATAEIMMETYFFKKVQEKDSNLLGVFRITRPISYFIAPALTSIGLYFVSFNYLFAILAAFMLIGVYMTMQITDTN